MGRSSPSPPLARLGESFPGPGGDFRVSPWRGTPGGDSEEAPKGDSERRLDTGETRKRLGERGGGGGRRAEVGQTEPGCETHSDGRGAAFRPPALAERASGTWRALVWRPGRVMAAMAKKAGAGSGEQQQKQGDGRRWNRNMRGEERLVGEEGSY